MAVVVLLLVVLAAVVMGARRYSAVSTSDVEWLAGPAFADPAAPDRQQAMSVCSRYLTRHVRHRRVGAVVGVLFGLVVGVRWSGSVTIGIGQGNPLADLLFCGLSGLIVGVLSAESFRIGTIADLPVAASLAPRLPSAGTERVLVARLIALAAFVVAILAGATGHGWRALAAWSILALPLVVAEVVRRAIADRRRPVMSDRAHLLDDRLRTFAASSVSLLHVALALLMLGWTISKIEGLTGVLAVLQFVVVVACLAFTVVMLVRAAPRQPRRERHAGPGGPTMSVTAPGLIR